MNTNSNKLSLSLLVLSTLVALVISCVLFINGCTQTSNTSTVDKSTSGAKETPTWLSNYETDTEFHITNNQQLIELAQFVNGTFKKCGDFSGKKVLLDADICYNNDCIATSSCMNNASEFWPIGIGSNNSDTNSQKSFCGEFNGNGHSISGLYVKDSTLTSLGLFGNVSSGANIHDFIVKNSFMESNTKNIPVGLIAKTYDKDTATNITISQIYIDSDVYFNAQNDAGGIIAKSTCEKSTISIDNCVFAGVSKSTYQQTNYDKTGKVSFQSNSAGIIGNAGKTKVNINNCLSMGFIMGGTNCSGIAGNAEGSISISKCVDVATLQCGSANYGFRFYGGQTAKQANPNAVVNEGIYISGDKQGELGDKATYNNVLKIDSIEEVKTHSQKIDQCEALCATGQIDSWIKTWSTTNGNFDVVVPSEIAKICPNSVYCTDEVVISEPEVTCTNGNFSNSLTYTVTIDANTIIKLGGIDKLEAGITYEIGNKEINDDSKKSISKIQNDGQKFFSTVTIDNISSDDANKEIKAKGFISDGNNTITSLLSVSNSLNNVAWKQFSDVESAESEYYRWMVEDNYFEYKYSPYTNSQRKQLLGLITDIPITNPDSEYATPESVGISSDEITGIMQDMADRGLNLHTMAIMRHGKIICEKYGEGYDENTLQRMYSVSKSITGISMCLLISDPQYNVSLSDPVGKYFPEYADCDPVILNTTIEQCMTMTTPFDHGVYQVGDKTCNNWLDTFFKTKIDKNPNANEFWYDTCGSYVTGVIVERVTGKTFLEYANERAFNQLGVSDDTWCVNAPEGYPWGGSGVMFTTRNLLEVGNFMQTQGKYQGEQIMNRDLAIAATSPLIDDSEEGYSFQDGRGYGYYTWITDFGFAFLGMGNQVYFAIPSLDMAFVCTSDNQGNSFGYYDIFELVARRLIANTHDGALPKNDEAYKNLQNYKIKLQTQKGNTKSSIADKVSKNTYNGGDSSKISEFNLDINAGKLTYTCHGETEKTINFGLGSNKFDNLDETSYSWKTINKPMTEDGRNDGYRIASSGAWKDDHTFVIFVQVIDDYLANMTMTFTFDDTGENVSLTNKYTAEGFLTEYKMSDSKFSKN